MMTLKKELLDLNRKERFEALGKKVWRHHVWMYQHPNWDKAKRAESFIVSEDEAFYCTRLVTFLEPAAEHHDHPIMGHATVLEYYLGDCVSDAHLDIDIDGKGLAEADSMIEEPLFWVYEQ